MVNTNNIDSYSTMEDIPRPVLMDMESVVLRLSDLEYGDMHRIAHELEEFNQASLPPDEASISEIRLENGLFLRVHFSVDHHSVRDVFLECIDCSENAIHLKAGDFDTLEESDPEIEALFEQFREEIEASARWED